MALTMRPFRISFSRDCKAIIKMTSKVSYRNANCSGTSSSKSSRKAGKGEDNSRQDSAFGLSSKDAAPRTPQYSSLSMIKSDLTVKSKNRLP